MLAPLDQALLERIEFPSAGSRSGDTRARPGQPVSTSRAEKARRAVPRRRRLPRLPRAAGARPAASAIVDEEGPARPARGRLAFTPASGAGSVSPPPSRSTRSAPVRPKHPRRRPPRFARLLRVEVTGALHLPVERAKAKLRLGSDVVQARVTPREGGFTLLDRPAFGVATGQLAALYDDEGAVVGCGVISSARRN